MSINHIIVQAGGKGTRLDFLTKNRPKALVSVQSKPILFHLFAQFPDAKFTIIADYKAEILEKYCAIFANSYDYNIIKTTHTGTCAGISQALQNIGDNDNFMLIWCDLILNKNLKIPNEIATNYCAISHDFVCRWRLENQQFSENPSKIFGVAGMFIFQNKQKLQNIPQNGEFVKWLSTQNFEFQNLDLSGSQEVGTLQAFYSNEMNGIKHRPFNKITIQDTLIIKEPADNQGAELAQKEIIWYQQAMNAEFHDIPIIHEFRPLKMEKIQGKNIYELGYLTKNFKTLILKNIIAKLQKIHHLYPQITANSSDFYENYYEKTISRLAKIQDLVPFAKDKIITINGKKYHNIYFHFDKIKQILSKHIPEQFHFIHGDCTFSNIILRNQDMEAVFIDPRGYFGNSILMGDKDYDWVKLYYSLIGNYDQFNNKNFSLIIHDNSVDISITASGFADCEAEFWQLTGANQEKIHLCHALTWLSLTTYAWDDYDAICGAFYIGTQFLGKIYPCSN